MVPRPIVRRCSGSVVASLYFLEQKHTLNCEAPPQAHGNERKTWLFRHYVGDVTFAEDRSRIRIGHAPQLLAACRNLVITLIHRSGSSHIAASRRSFSYHP